MMFKVDFFEFYILLERAVSVLFPTKMFRGPLRFELHVGHVNMSGLIKHASCYDSDFTCIYKLH